MARARGGYKSRRRKNRVLKLAKGFHFDRRRKFKWTSETVRRALHNIYKGRRLLKRDMRRLWITRISAASKLMGTTYSRLIHQLKTNNVTINRKMLADIAARDMDAFTSLVKSLK
ncbi:50S ribosomal protein L20 [Bacteriovoracaceae bacterium]|nr:50S ribosomal protein L20 [Bacteriovoracaceae bacterium]